MSLGEGLYTSFVQGWDALVWKCLQHGATSDAIKKALNLFIPGELISNFHHTVNHCENSRQHSTHKHLASSKFTSGDKVLEILNLNLVLS